MRKTSVVVSGGYTHDMAGENENRRENTTLEISERSAVPRGGSSSNGRREVMLTTPNQQAVQI